MSTTKEENKTEENTYDDQQKLETAKFFEKTPPNLKRSEPAGIGDDRAVCREGKEDSANEKDEKLGPGGESVKISDIAAADARIDPSSSEYEKKVLSEAFRLLSSPIVLSTGEESEGSESNMSRLTPKGKTPSKSVSRPSLSHVNKLPGELSGQPSIKNTKDDVKYWKSREQELLDKIAALESKAAAADPVKDKFHSTVDQAGSQKHEKADGEVASSAREKDNYKNRLQQIEKELFAKQKEQSKEPNLKGMKNPDEIINHLKAQNEDLRGALAKMTAILRDKTALCVTQEKKVAALTNQVESLKEVVAITKDLLNIRNMEVQHISNDISAMETKIDCERQRHNQMLIKMDEAVKLNSELKKEYENQMKLFQHLRDNYEEKIRMISQNTIIEENKEQLMDQQRNADGSMKVTQNAGKLPKSSNFKNNFQES